MKIIAAALSGIIAACVLFFILFKTKEEFIECVKFWIKPDILSFFKGEYIADHWAEFKLWIWVSGSIGVASGVYALFK